MIGGAITGAVLGAAKGAILGEDIGRSALFGAVGGGIGGYTSVPSASSSPYSLAGGTPTAGTAGGTELAGALPDAEKDILGDLLGGSGIADGVESKGKDQPAISIVQLAQCLCSSLYDQPDQSFIVECRVIQLMHHVPAGSEPLALTGSLIIEAFRELVNRPQTGWESSFGRSR